MLLIRINSAVEASLNLYIHAVKLQMTASQMQAQQVQVGINQELNQKPSVLYLFTVESEPSRIGL